ncbi:hypothetical protein OC835_003203 [Tilletia horrida]|nr:hypothetical protein OC835_003203 [Tilletia horrida]KAK0565490.1 hypothetical protein OC844_001216 [Tilletia horrida]
MKGTLTTSLAFTFAVAAATVIAALPQPKGTIPYSFYSLEFQAQLAKNKAAIQGKPYAKYFDPELYVYPEMINPGRNEIDCPTQAMKPDLSDINALNVPATTTLPVENGWCAYSDGSAYVASRTHFPGATGEQAQWWLWWHSAESARYSLWHPYAHVSVASSFANKFNDTSLNATQKLYGSVHHITEIIQEVQESIDIHWYPPSHFGLDESKFAANGIVAAGCGEIYIGNNTPIKAINMIHLWYQTADGLDLRSRYYIANNVQLDIPIIGKLIPINTLANLFGIKKIVAGRNIAMLQ